MPSVPCFNLRFTPTWIMCFLTLIVVLLFLRLGFWQLQRAEQKREMIAAEFLMANKPWLQWDGKGALPAQYQRVTVKGHFQPDLFLLDNQHQHHQFGYDVLSPLVLNNGQIVLIDRGWIAGDTTRRIFPSISIPGGIVQIRGTVYFPSSKQWVLGPSIEKKNDKLTILEYLNTKIASQILQKTVYPFIIRLDKQAEFGFVRNWAIVSMPPERHIAYAWQWFSMAIAVFIIFIALNLKKDEQIN